METEVGLANLAAPVVPGAVMAESYKLVSTSRAINSGIHHNDESSMDFWGQSRDIRPDIGAHEYPAGSADPPVGDKPELPAAGSRVTKGLVSLYEFKEKQGREVRDTSGYSDALNLRIKDESRVSWTEEGLLIKQPVLISSERPATKIIKACRQSNEITLEAWIRPANVIQDGPARIVGISSKTQRNVTLGQGLHGNRPADLYMARLRTTQTSTNGLPAVVSPPGTATSNLTHVVYVRSKNNRAILYINGQDRGILDVGGDFSNWDETMPLLIGDEVSEDRPWLGLLHLCAVYSRALAPAEVLHNYEANYRGDVSLLADFSIPPGDEHGIIPHVVEFDSSESTSTSGITAYFWEFGDGQTSNRATPTITYTAPRIYSVSLTITDSNGQTDKVTKEKLITVVEKPVAPLPADYARFVLINLSDSVIKAFGIQYPDYRCALVWNDEPFHMMVYADIDDVLRIFTTDNTVGLVWVDSLEEE